MFEAFAAVFFFSFSLGKTVLKKVLSTVEDFAVGFGIEFSFKSAYQ